MKAEEYLRQKRKVGYIAWLDVVCIYHELPYAIRIDMLEQLRKEHEYQCEREGMKTIAETMRKNSV